MVNNETNTVATGAHQDATLILSLLTMSAMVEARDPYTGGHLWRVSQYALRLALAAGLTEEEAVSLALGGFLHDLGKIAIPDAILNKRGPLTEEEYEVIKTHPNVGASLIESHPISRGIKSAVASHHERPDGRGYPRGLDNRELTLHARVIGLCDAFDAMTSHRPYRAGMPLAKALDIIISGLGTQFDEELGQIFIGLARAGQCDDILGHSDGGVPLQQCPMCGPTLVVRREHHHGNMLYCRSCGGENRLVKVGAILRVEPTGRAGSPQQLEPALDHRQLAELAGQWTLAGQSGLLA